MRKVVPARRFPCAQPRLVGHGFEAELRIHSHSVDEHSGIADVDESRPARCLADEMTECLSRGTDIIESANETWYYEME